MRTRLIAVVIVLAAALTGCTVAPRAHDGPLIIPLGIAWRYAMSCIEPAEGIGVAAMQLSNEGADVILEESDDPSVDIAALEAQIEACLSKYRYQEHIDAYIDPYERERLYEYYSTFTVPCLENEGIHVDPVPRFAFIDPQGGEPWNPYLGMDLPFDRLIELYGICPPRPSSLTEADNLG